MTRFLFVLLVAGSPGGMAHASPARAVLAALTDARTLAPEECRATRYLWQPVGYSEEERAALDLLANLLSRSPRLARPRWVADDLLAFTIDSYDWAPAVWDKLAEIDPYFTVRAEVLAEVVEQKWYPAGNYDGRFYEAGFYPVKVQKRTKQTAAAPWADPEAHAALQRLTGSLIPVVRGDWWLSQACRQVDVRGKENGAGYYDWLGIKDRAAYYALTDFDPVRADKRLLQVRAVVDRSGVSQHTRVVVGYEHNWFTLDDDGQTADNLPTELLKPGVYRHKAEEHFGRLPNGLPVFGLFDAGGKNQASAPDFIGPDDSPLRTGRDGRIHVGLSCLRCHFQGTEDGMRPIDCFVRRTFRGSLEAGVYGREEKLEFERLYLSNLDRKQEKTRAGYREALGDLLGPSWTWQRAATVLSRYHDRYTAPVGLTQLASECGLPADDLLARLKERSKVQGGVSISLGPLLRNDTVRRETAEDFFAVVMALALEAK